MVANRRDPVKDETLALQWHFKVHSSSAFPSFNLAFTAPSLPPSLPLSPFNPPKSQLMPLLLAQTGRGRPEKQKEGRVSKPVTFLRKFPDWQVTLTPRGANILQTRINTLFFQSPGRNAVSYNSPWTNSKWTLWDMFLGVCKYTKINESNQRAILGRRVGGNFLQFCL